MRVLDLFAGKGGWSQAFEERGHQVTTVEIDPSCEPDICADILTLQPGMFHRYGHEPFDLILASPPCEKFSIMAASHYWAVDDNGFVPSDPRAVEAMKLPIHTLYLLNALKPRAAIMENPRGMMRKVLPVRPHTTVTYCSYGDTRMKPTDLWLFGAAREFFFKPMCKNKRGQDTDCHHEASPRGSRTGTQTPMSYHDRSLVPYGLSLAMCEQMELYLAGELPDGRLAV